MRPTLLRTIAWLALLGAALTPVCAADEAAGAPHLTYERFWLENGLTVVLHPSHTVPTVAVQVRYEVGSANEPPGRSGFAHLFEHLMFTGTPRVPGGGFDEILEAEGGSSNATTDLDYTEYHTVGPAHLLPTMLWLEADRMETFGDGITQEKLDLQRDVVRNELRESYEEAPYGSAYLALNPHLYPVGHPYHDPVVGTHRDLERATLSDVQEFFRAFYVPNNAILVVAGDFEPAPTRALIERLFATIPRGVDPERPTADPFQLPGPRTVVLPDEVESPQLTLAWPSPPYFQEGDAEMDVLAVVLAGGEDGRLVQRLVREEGLASHAYAWQESLRLGSNFVVQVTARPDVSRADLARATREALAGLLREGPEPGEVRRAVARLETDLVQSVQSNLGVADRMSTWQGYRGEPDLLAFELDRYRRVTAESCREVGRRVLDLERCLALWIVPAEQEAVRDLAPAIGAQAPFHAPTPTTFRLPNGLVVWVLPRPGLPLVAASLLLRGGAATDPPSRAGRALLGARMLREGTGELDGVAFARVLAESGVEMSVGADRECAALGFEVLSARLPSTLALLGQAVQHPRLAAEAFEQLRGRHLAELEQAEGDPEVLAPRVALVTFLEDRDPTSARDPRGSVESVSSLTIDDVRSWHQAACRPERAVLLLAGDLDTEESRRLVDSAFGAWAPGQDARPTAIAATSPIAPPSTARVRRLVLVDRPGASQTIVRLLVPAPSFTSSERDTVRTLAAILGGTFTSRLNMNLREEHGYTYGVHAGYLPIGPVGALSIGGSFETQVTRLALEQLFHEIDGLAEGNATSAETAKAVASLRADVVAGFESLGSTLGAYEPYALRASAPDALDASLEVLDGMQAARLNLAAPTALGLSQAVLVLVGDVAAIGPTLEGLGLPPPEVLTTRQAAAR